jgi:hypothetical protein
VHVARPPDTHDVCPAEQLFEHVSEHIALGAAPEQDSDGMSDVHDVVPETKRQPFVSVWHVASVAELSHSEPFCVHAVALHEHEAMGPDVVHVWFVPQVCVVTHAVHPFDWTSHVCAAPGEHCCVPCVHALVQHDADPALPEQAPPVHVVDDDS